jgi:gluconokinase
MKDEYADIQKGIASGKSDMEMLDWCYANGRRPNDEEVFIWNLFMEKRGWRDDDSPLVQREKESIGLGHRDEIQTLFDFYDFDEGRRS